MALFECMCAQRCPSRLDYKSTSSRTKIRAKFVDLSIPSENVLIRAGRSLALLLVLSALSAYENTQY